MSPTPGRSDDELAARWSAGNAFVFRLQRILFGSSKSAVAGPPAQFVCSASHIFSGRVLKATNDEVLHLTIRVDQILGVAAPREQTASFPVLQKNDVITAESSISAVFDNRSSPGLPGLHVLKDGPRQIFDNDSEIIPLFVGNEFLFGLNQRVSESGVDIWYLAEKGWLRRIFAGCNRDNRLN
jgi:hypothetical protein